MCMGDRMKDEVFRENVKEKLDPIADKIRKSNGLPLDEVHRMCRAVNSSLRTLTINYPIYEEERAGARKNRVKTYINIW